MRIPYQFEPQQSARQHTHINHPTENPKPPKSTKAEIQQAAKEKKEAKQVKKAATVAKKKKKHLETEEQCKQSAQQIAAIEDNVQHLQKELQSHLERPDLKTMKTYKEQIEEKKAFFIKAFHINAMHVANQEENKDDKDG